MNVKLKVLILVMALAIFVNSIGVAYLLFEVTNLWEALSDILYNFLPGAKA